MEFKKYYLTKNDCYKKATKITPKGIVVHSTGANNPYLKRYVGPDDGILGVNKYNNDWNRSGTILVHAFIGKDKNGVVRCYNTLPFNYAAWGVGKGSKGSYNYNPTGYIQFEICEDGLTDKTYFESAFNLAAEFCAYLMKEYNIKIENVVSHHEAHLKGYASNHGDCDNWLKKFGKDMNWFRNLVNSKVNSQTETTKPNTSQESSQKFKIGDKVIINGSLYASSNADKPSSTVKNKTTVITRYSKGSKHPYNTTGDLGWMNESDIKLVSENNFKSYLVIINVDSLNVRNGAGTNYKINTTVKRNEVFTIVAEQNGWGKLKSGAGWIYLKYCKKK